MADKDFILGSVDKKPISVSVSGLLATRMLVQANSGGGKSFTLRRILEQTYGATQQIVIDPEGEFASLREKYDYLLVGNTGEEHGGADIQASVKSADVLAERILAVGVSAIIDLYELDENDRIRFVSRFLKGLINAPKDLWHPALIVVDEAHVFAPEGRHSESLNAMMSLATRGRKRGFGSIFATQRISMLSKDVTGQLNNKLIGRSAQSLDTKRSLEELYGPKAGASHAQELKRLGPGNFFVFGPAIKGCEEEIRVVKVGSVVTTHPEMGQSYTPPPPRKAIAAVMTEFAKISQEADEREKSLADLKRDNATLKAENTRLKNGAADPEEIRRLTQERDDARTTTADLYKRLADLAPTLKDLRAAADGLTANLAVLESKTSITVVPIRATKPAIQEKIRPEPARKAPQNENSDIKPLRSGAMKMLKAAAMFYPDAVSRQRIATIAGFSVSGGSFGTYLSELIRAGWLEKSVSDYVATALGMTAAGDVDPIPTDPRALLDMWKEQFRAGAGDMLEALFKHGAMTKEQLGDWCGKVFTGGTFGTYLSELRRNNLVTVEGGKIQLIEELWR